jgi:DNA-binding transcriptional LysR family regulator
MMNLGDVAVLVEAVHGGSLAGAARRLGVAPMVASRRLAALEDELGVRLVHRTTRALSLTTAGEAFFPYAEAMLENEADGRASVRPSDAGASGLLRVTASVPFGRKVVTPMIAGFLAANPEVRVDLLLSDSVVDIVAQGIDVALRIAPLRDNTLIARRLAPNPRALYAAPGYVAAHGAPGRMADLTGHVCLALTDVSHWQFQRDGEPLRQRIAGRFTASSIDALHRACLDGIGIALLSAWNTADDVAAGRLVALPLADAEPEPWAIWAVYPTSRFVPPKVRLFVAALERHLAPRPAPAGS